MNTKLVLDLFSIGAIQFGEFRLKSGLMSPIYLDLRLLVSHPRVLKDVALALSGILEQLTFDRIAAIPFAGLPIGVAVSLAMNRPLIYPRRETKDHGIARPIEGVFNKGEIAVVIDDVITTGKSKIETLEPLLAAGLLVRDIVVLIDREQGGTGDLDARGYQVHSAMRLSHVLDALSDAHKITDKQRQDVMALVVSRQ